MRKKCWAFAFALLLALALTACDGNNTNQDAQNSAETEEVSAPDNESETENAPQSEQDNSTSARVDFEKTLSSVESSVKKNYFPDGNCDLSYNDGRFTVITWDDTHNQAHALTVLGLSQGKENSLDVWNLAIKEAQIYAESIQNVFHILGYDDITVDVKVVNTENHDNVWLITDSNSVLFDVMDSVKTLVASSSPAEPQVPETSESEDTPQEPPTPTTPEPFEVELTADADFNDGYPIFTVYTNLPDQTKLVLTLKDGYGYTGQADAEVKNGVATSSEFSNRGEALSGKHTLSVSMSLARLQPKAVQEVIGEHGEYIVSANKS